MEKNEFDDIIKSKLEQINQAPDARAWDLFVLSAMDKNQEEIFDDTSTDDLVRSALKDYKVDYDAQSWEKLADKLEEKKEADPVVLQAKFDKEISSSLKGLQKKYDAASWPKLAARIEAEEKYLRDYYRAKFVEATLFILLVLTLFQLGESGRFKLPFEKPAESLENVKTLPPIASNATESELKTYENVITSNLPASGLNQNEIISNSNDESAEEIIQNEIKKPFEENTNLTTTSFNTANPSIGSKRNSIGDIDNLALPISYAQRVEDKVSVIADQLNSNSLSYQRTVQAETIQNNINHVDHLAALGLPSLSKLKQKGNWSIGTYARMDYNEIYLPEQILELRGAENKVAAKTAKSFGYSAGFKSLYSKKNVGLELGVGYTNRYYQPDRVYSGYTDLRAHFIRIEYDMLEVPLAVRYATKPNTRLKPYVQVGINNSFIVKSIYDVAVLPLQISTSTTKADQEWLKTQITRQFTKFDVTKFMLYAQGAVGLDWKLNQTVNLNSQVTYSQRFLAKKFGPNFDQAKSLSLEIGIKTIL